MSGLLYLYGERKEAALELWRAVHAGRYNMPDEVTVAYAFRLIRLASACISSFDSRVELLSNGFKKHQLEYAISNRQWERAAKDMVERYGRDSDAVQIILKHGPQRDKREYQCRGCKETVTDAQYQTMDTKWCPFCQASAAGNFIVVPIP